MSDCTTLCEDCKEAKEYIKQILTVMCQVNSIRTILQSIEHNSYRLALLFS